MTRDDWRPIAEAPRDGTRVLVWVPGLMVGYGQPGIVVAEFSTDYRHWFHEYCDGPDDQQPTHWMPLPPPPAGEG